MSPAPAVSAHEPEGRALVGLPFVQRLFVRLRAHGLSRHAAELAFWSFLALLPLAVMAALLVSRLVHTDTPAGVALLEALPRNMRELLRGELDRVALWHAAPVTLVAGVTFLWLSSNALLAVFAGVERIARAAPDPRRGRLAALGLSAIVAVVGAALFCLVGGVGWIALLAGQSPARVEAFESSSFGSGVRVVLGGALWLGAIYGVLRFSTPRTARGFMPVAPGAILTVGAQVGLASGGRFYLRELAERGAFVAAVSSIAITIGGLFLAAAAVFVGAAFNQQLGERVRLRLRARRRLDALRRKHVDALADR